MTTVAIEHAPRRTYAWRWLGDMVRSHHYLNSMPDTRTSFETFVIRLGDQIAGGLVVGRPEATRCADWYGGVDDVRAGRCAVTRWQVLNLSRMWIHPSYQAKGAFCLPDIVPGYFDRCGVWRPTLASAALRAALGVIRYEYLLRRPPCFLEEPYQIDWLLSYCDTAQHRGTIYAAAGFELYRTNARGIQTWRIRLPALTAEQDAQIRAASAASPRSQRYRAERAQLQMELT